MVLSLSAKPFRHVLGFGLGTWTENDAGAVIQNLAGVDYRISTRIKHRPCPMNGVAQQAPKARPALRPVATPIKKPKFVIPQNINNAKRKLDLIVQGPPYVRFSEDPKNQQIR